VGVTFGAAIRAPRQLDGTLHDGVFPTDNRSRATSSTAARDRDRLYRGAQTQGTHTFRAALSYQGTTLSETITDRTTGATFHRAFSNVNSPAASRRHRLRRLRRQHRRPHGTMAITNWTYSTGGKTVIDHSGGFASHGDVTASGTTVLSGGEADLDHRGR